MRTGGQVRVELSGELWEGVGDTRMRSGDTAGAAAAYGSALEPAVVDLPASPGVLTPPAGRSGLRTARLHRKAAAALLAGTGEASAAEPHLASAERALTAAGGDPAEAGRLLRTRADWLRGSGRPDEALQAAEAGLALAGEHGDGDDLAAAGEALAAVHQARGTWREGLHREIERLGASADEDGRTARALDIHSCPGQYQLYGDGQAGGVEEYARRTLDLAHVRGARRAEAFAWCLLGESLLLRGRWDEAPGCLERSAHLYEELDDRSGGAARQRLAEYAAGRGDSAAAAYHLGRGTAAAEAAPPAVARHVFGRLYAAAALDAVERGEPGEAARAACAAAASAALRGECPSCTAPLYPLAAEAFAALGDPAGAAEHAAAARRVSSRSDSSAWRAMAESALGSLAAARGDPRGARVRHLAAAALYERGRQPFWAAREKALALAAHPGPAEGTGRSGPGRRRPSRRWAPTGPWIGSGAGARWAHRARRVRR